MVGMRSVLLLVPWLLLLSGCGGAASLVLKTPLEDRCTELRLKSCDRLTGGVLLHVDGDRARGNAELRAGLASNTERPQQLKDFATAMRLLQKAPGVGPYVATLRPVIDLVDEAATEALRRKKDLQEPQDEAAPQRSGKDPEETTAASTPRSGRAVSVGNLRTGMVAWTPGKGQYSCEPLAEAPGLLRESVGRCTLVLDGPLVLTDVLGAECPQDRLVFSGEPERPEWFLHLPAGQAVRVQGAALALPSGAPLQVALLLPVGSGSSVPAGCSLVWSAYRP
jgi:hypothetical protein